MNAFSNLHGRTSEGLVLETRRGMIKAGMAGLAGLTLPDLLRHRAAAASQGQKTKTGKSIILLWMAGGPSHIDTFDPKPLRPYENRGPFSVIDTKLPGIQICEHLPKHAAMMDKLTLVRSIDCRKSNHEPNMVMQTGHRGSAPRVNPKGRTYPSFGSVVGKMHGSNKAGMPPYVAFMRSRSHLAFAGHLGKRYDPFLANKAAKLPIYDLVGKDTGRRSGADIFRLPLGLNHDRIDDRCGLLQQLDNMRSDLDLNGSMNALDGFTRQAVEMLVGQRAHQAFDLEREPKAIRERYGKHLWCQQTLLARRLVQAGAAFVTLDLSYHTASGTWDTHGDKFPPYGGIKSGLTPLLPLFDHLMTTLVTDLEQQGMIDDTLVLAMGEFGRTPKIGTQGSVDGRNHWPRISQLLLAGGGYRHGQVIGASERDGGHIKERPVTPGDLAATILRHFDIPQDTTYLDPRGRPHYVVQEGGKPLRELT